MDRGHVILVDEYDQQTGTAEKMKAHLEGQLHRAFSIFLFNRRGEMLLQQRALEKYHSGGLWTNACCSHPVEGMELIAFAKLRLSEEMGFETELQKIFDFVYKAEMENGLIEHEFDHVLFGEYEGPIVYNSGEVMNCCYMSLADLERSLSVEPDKYTAWFRMVFPRVKEWYTISHQPTAISLSS